MRALAVTVLIVGLFLSGVSSWADSDTASPEEEIEAIEELLYDFHVFGLKDPAIVDALVTALQSADFTVRVRAAQALGEVGDVRAVERLIQALEDENAYVRAHAAGALGKVRDRRAVASLIEQLHDTEPFVKAYAVEALGEIGDPRATEPLIGLLIDDEDRLSSHAAWALGSIRDLRAISPLIQALRARKRFPEAVEALRKITNEDFGADHEGWLAWWTKIREEGTTIEP